MKNSLLCRS